MSSVEATRTVEVAGRRTRLLDVGDGYPVVVLHGWGGRIESMAPVVACLRPSMRVLAVDLVGFGLSDPPEGAWGTPDHAEFVNDLLDDLGVERAHFLGHSFGAKTSLCIAATHPGRVDKLVLVGASGIRAPASLEVRAKRALSRAARVAGHLGRPGKRARDAVYRRISSEDYRSAGVLRATLVRVVNEDLRHLMPLVKSPTLLVWGTEDQDVPVEHARTMERLIPDAGLVLLEGAGHFAYLDEPERFCRIVRHFFQSG